MAKKFISDYLPEKQQIEVINIQGQVPKRLGEAVKKIMKKKEITWNELLTACLERFLDETEEKSGTP